MNHTPGPWNLLEVGAGRLCPAGAGNLSILTIEYEGDEDETPFAAVYHPADARLIAAAPDMLEALKAVHNCGNAGAKLSRVASDKVRAAIAKAEGR